MKLTALQEKRLQELASPLREWLQLPENANPPMMVVVTAEQVGFVETECAPTAGLAPEDWSNCDGR